MNRSPVRILLAALTALGLVSIASARDIYVALDGTGNLPQHGYDWTTAYTNIQYVATFIARTNSIVYIKGGTWSLTNHVAFRGTNLVVMGGYEGVGAPGSNNPALWPTIFTRNIEAEVTNRIMAISATNSIFKNLKLIGGFATTNCENNNHPIPTDSQAYGGGIYIVGSSNVTISGCTIISNSAVFGGGVYINSNSFDILITNCVISKNSLVQGTNVSIYYGAGIYQYTGSVTIANAIIQGNRTEEQAFQGLAVYQRSGALTLRNCTVAKHYSEGIRRDQSSASIIISNSILWDYGAVLNNVPVTNVYYSIVRNGEGVFTNTGCFYDDPLFVNEAEDEFHLQSMQGHWKGNDYWEEDYSNSPAIDAGSPDAIYNNENMPNGGRINLGAYGNTEQASRTLSPPILRISSRMVVTNYTMTNFALLGHGGTNQPFYIWNSNGYSRDLCFTNTTSVSWLSTDPISAAFNYSNTPFISQLGYNTEFLPLGTHTGLVTVTAVDSRGNTCGNSPASIRAVVHVLTSPTMALQPTNLTRSVIYGSNAPSQSFEIWNSTDTRFGLLYSAVPSAAWLSVTPNSGSSYGEHDTLTVNYDVAGLGPGSHTATIAVYGAVSEYPLVAVTNSPQFIKVTAVVTRAPIISVMPAAISNSVTVGHTAPRATFDVWNSSLEPRGALSYSTWTDKPWVSAEPSTGSSTGEHDTINLWFNTTNMVAGIYTSKVTVAAGHWSAGIFYPIPSVANSPCVLPLILNINTTPELGIYPRGFTNYITLGGNAPNRAFKLWNGADAPKGPLAFVITNDKPWVAASPASGEIDGNTIKDINVLFNTAILANGNYHGVLTIHAYDPTTGEDLGRINIDNSVMVRPLPVLSLNPSSISQVILQHIPAVSRQIDLWNGSASPKAMMNYIITWDKPWLSITPDSGFSAGAASPAALTFNAEGLEPGIHNATITIIAWDESTGQAVFGSPRNVPVTLQILPRLPANQEAPSISGLPYIGQSLNVTPGLWTPPVSVAFTTQWQRADNAFGQSLQDIPGATRTNYVVQRADAGKYIRAKIVAVEASTTPILTNLAYTAFADQLKIRAKTYDFDTDGKADTWFYNPPVGGWHFLPSSTRLDAYAAFGWSEALPVPGDYDGDGALDLAVYYQAGGLWYILTASGDFRLEHFGWWEADPVPADYDGDGATDLAVYYPPAGAWYILTAKREFYAINFGFLGATPVPGDYDGDRAADLALYHQALGNWYALSLSGNLLLWAYNFGWYAAMPVPGDYTGSGALNLAVYDQAANLWYFLVNNQLLIGTFGTSNGKGVPMIADYDGDAISDLATVHISGNLLIWCIYQSSEGYKGVTYDAKTGRWR